MSQLITVSTDPPREKVSPLPLIYFEDPPDPSPARIYAALRDIDVATTKLKLSLPPGVTAKGVNGYNSEAFTGQSIAALWFVLGGIAGGIAGAIGEDVWVAIREYLKQIWSKNRKGRNVTIVVLNLDERDIEIQLEGKHPERFHEFLADAPQLLEQLSRVLRTDVQLAGYHTIGLAKKPDGDGYVLYRYNYRRSDELTNIPEIEPATEEETVRFLDGDDIDHSDP